MAAITPRWSPLRGAVLVSLALGVHHAAQAQAAAEPPPLPSPPRVISEPVEPAPAGQHASPAPTGATDRPGADGAAPAATLQSGGPASLPSERVRNTLFNHHATTQTPINAANVQRVTLAWAVPTQSSVSHAPLMDGERIYFADWDGQVYAVDSRDGSIAWQKKVEQNVKRQWPWHGFAGTGAMSGDMLFEASVEGMAYGIDKRTGNVVWQQRIADDPEAGSLARLTAWDGRLYVGLQSVEEPMTAMKKDFKPDFRGKVMALDARTGKKLWERSLVEPPHNGVAVWSSFALDPEANTLYFTTGNNYTGDASPLSDSLVAVDATTGQMRWHRQVTNFDVWTKADPQGPDYDFGAGPQLFDAVIDGRPRKLVGAGQKSGVFYVWDRLSGDPVWTFTLGYGHVGGGMHGEASIAPGRILLWSNNAFPYSNPAQHPMDIAAIDPASGKPFWRKPKVQPALQISAGHVANDVWFLGSLDGKVRAYSIQNGERLWTSGEHGSVASSIGVQGDLVAWGAGVPQMFGGNAGQPGLYAYRVASPERAR